MTVQSLGHLFGHGVDEEELEQRRDLADRLANCDRWVSSL